MPFLRYQEQINISDTVQFKTDLVLYDSLTRKPRYILDTKYKTCNYTSKSDISQVVTYAIAKNCYQAILVYPINLKQPLDEKIGNIRVRSLTFSLETDLNQAGKSFLANLLIV